MPTSIEKFSFGFVVFTTLILPVLLFLLLIVGGAVLGEGMEDTLFLPLLGLGFFFTVCVAPVINVILGVFVERARFKALAIREQELADIIVSDMRTPPPNWKITQTFFVCENVVLGNNFLKRLFWTFRKLVGGRSRGMTKLVELTRREAVVRLMARAREYGANVVWNVRLETSIVYSNSSGQGKSSTGVEVMAYGTAFVVDNRAME